MKTVLVVEDNPLVRELIVSCLAKLSARVRAVSSAEDAIEALRNDGKPDLILIDVVLPRRSGSDLIRHLRNQDLTRDVPAV
ncbi:MAG: response regulator, partial [Chloroflexi bacterium]|nr:response regulator [Chloroflexota bacterium]